MEPAGENPWFVVGCQGVVSWCVSEPFGVTAGG
jgi:hypothetical protein